MYGTKRNRMRDLIFGWPPEPNSMAPSAVEPAGGEKGEKLTASLQYTQVSRNSKKNRRLDKDQESRRSEDNSNCVPRYHRFDPRKRFGLCGTVYVTCHHQEIEACPSTDSTNTHARKKPGKVYMWRICK
jgi:hypothetical protein